MSNSDTRYRLTDPPKQLGVAALYVLLARIVLTFFSGNGVISVIWPSSGLALAVLLIGGKRYFWGVFLGAFLAYAMTGITFMASVAIAAGNTLEALICVWMLTRSNVGFDIALQSLRSYLLLILAGIIGSICGALAGTTTWLFTGFLTSDTYLLNLSHWWMGDVLGIVLFTPLTLVWWRTKNDWPGTKRIAEAALLLSLTFLAGQAVFLDWFHDSVGHVARGYMMFLFITWVAVRLGTRGTVIALAITASQALLGAHRGAGFFADDIAHTQLANYWFYTVILSMVGMTLSTFLAKRQMVEKELQESNSHLLATLDAVPDLLFEAGLDGRIYGYHSPRTDLLAAPPEVFLGKTFSDFLPSRVAEVCMSALQDAHENGVSMGEQYELPLPQGRVWFELSVSRKPVSSGQEPRFIVLARDITERKQADEVLKLNKQIIDTAMDGFWIIDMAGNLRRVNEAYSKLTGYTMDELLNMHISELDASGQSREEIAAHVKNIAAKGYERFEVRHRRKDGQEFDVEIAARFMPESQLFCGFLRDVTERKAAEQRLHELAANILNVREDEKKHIAREIHDQLGGTLNALKVDAYWLSRKLPVHDESAALAKRIETMEQRIDDAIKFTRRVIDDMRPAVLDDLGLLAAIEWQAAEFNERTGIDCQVNCVEDEANLDKRRSVALFRILQEALTNVSRHSGASRVNIEYLHSEKEVLLTVSDNGCGMPEGHITASKPDGSTCYGMLGMKERVEQFCGNITFSSPQGGGFSVKATLPLPAGETSA